MSENIRPGLTPRPAPPPPPPVQVRLTGKVIYPAGPWGTSRPLRHRAQLVVWEGQIFDPAKVDPKRRRPVGQPETTLIATGNRIPMGNVVEFYRGARKSWVFWTEHDGSFRFTTEPIDVYTNGLVLEITDYNFASSGEDIKSCIVSLIPGPIDLSTTLSSQSAGSQIRVPWWPPKFMTQLAIVNGTAFVDSQKLAAQLAAIVRSPFYPTTIKLGRESALDQVNVTGEDFTHAEKAMEKLSNGNLPAGFPERVVAAVGGIPRLNVKAKSTAEAIALILERLVTTNIQELEKKTILNPLLNALTSALGDSYIYDDPTDEAPVDMAAALTLLCIAGLMARDRVKPSVVYSSSDLSNNQKWLKVDVLIKK